MARLLLTRLVVLAVLVVCAAIITELSTVSLTENSSVAWISGAMPG